MMEPPPDKPFRSMTPQAYLYEESEDDQTLDDSLQARPSPLGSATSDKDRQASSINLDTRSPSTFSYDSDEDRGLPTRCQTRLSDILADVNKGRQTAVPTSSSCDFFDPEPCSDDDASAYEPCLSQRDNKTNSCDQTAADTRCKTLAEAKSGDNVYDAYTARYIAKLKEAMSEYEAFATSKHEDNASVYEECLSQRSNKTYTAEDKPGVNVDDAGTARAIAELKEALFEYEDSGTSESEDDNSIYEQCLSQRYKTYKGDQNAAGDSQDDAQRKADAEMKAYINVDDDAAARTTAELKEALFEYEDSDDSESEDNASVYGPRSSKRNNKNNSDGQTATGEPQDDAQTKAEAEAKSDDDVDDTDTDAARDIREAVFEYEDSGASESGDNDSVHHNAAGETQDIQSDMEAETRPGDNAADAGTGRDIAEPKEPMFDYEDSDASINTVDDTNSRPASTFSYDSDEDRGLPTRCQTRLSDILADVNKGRQTAVPTTSSCDFFDPEPCSDDDDSVYEQSLSQMYRPYQGDQSTSGESPNDAKSKTEAETMSDNNVDDRSGDVHAEPKEAMFEYEDSDASECEDNASVYEPRLSQRNNKTNSGEPQDDAQSTAEDEATPDDNVDAARDIAKPKKSMVKCEESDFSINTMNDVTATRSPSSFSYDSDEDRGLPTRCQTRLSDILADVNKGRETAVPTTSSSCDFFDPEPCSDDNDSVYESMLSQQNKTREGDQSSSGVSRNDAESCAIPDAKLSPAREIAHQKEGMFEYEESDASESEGMYHSVVSTQLLPLTTRAESFQDVGHQQHGKCSKHAVASLDHTGRTIPRCRTSATWKDDDGVNESWSSQRTKAYKDDQTTTGESHGDPTNKAEAETSPDDNVDDAGVARDIAEPKQAMVKYEDSDAFINTVDNKTSSSPSSFSYDSDDDQSLPTGCQTRLSDILADVNKGRETAVPASSSCDFLDPEPCSDDNYSAYDLRLSQRHKSNRGDRTTDGEPQNDAQNYMEAEAKPGDNVDDAATAKEIAELLKEVMIQYEDGDASDENDDAHTIAADVCNSPTKQSTRDEHQVERKSRTPSTSPLLMAFLHESDGEDCAANDVDVHTKAADAKMDLPSKHSTTTEHRHKKSRTPSTSPLFMAFFHESDSEADGSCQTGVRQCKGESTHAQVDGIFGTASLGRLLNVCALQEDTTTKSKSVSDINGPNKKAKKKKPGGKKRKKKKKLDLLPCNGLELFSQAVLPPIGRQRADNIPRSKSRGYLQELGCHGKDGDTKKHDTRPGGLQPDAPYKPEVPAQAAHETSSTRVAKFRAKVRKEYKLLPPIGDTGANDTVIGLTKIEAPEQTPYKQEHKPLTYETTMLSIEAPEQIPVMHVTNTQTTERPLMTTYVPEQMPFFHVPIVQTIERPMVAKEVPQQKPFFHVPKVPTPETPLMAKEAPEQKPFFHVPKVQTPETPFLAKEAPEQKPFFHVPKAPTPETPLMTKEMPMQKPFFLIPKAPSPERPLMTIEAPGQKPFFHVPKAPTPETTLTTKEVPTQKPFFHVPKAQSPERPLMTIEAPGQKAFFHVPKAPTPETTLMTKEVPTQKPIFHVPKAPSPEIPLMTIEAPGQKPFFHVPKAPTPETTLMTKEVPTQKPIFHVPKAPSPERPLMTIEAPGQKPVFHVPKAPTPETTLMTKEVPTHKPFFHVPKAPSPEIPLMTIEAPGQKPVFHVPKVPIPETKLIMKEVPEQKSLFHVPKAPIPERPLETKEVPAQKAFFHVPKAPTPERPLVTKDASEQKPFFHAPKAPTPKRQLITKDAPEQKPLLQVPQAPTAERTFMTKDVPDQKPFFDVPKVPTSESPLMAKEAPEQKPLFHVPDAPTFESPLMTKDTHERKTFEHVPKTLAPKRAMPELKPFLHLSKSQTTKRPMMTKETPSQKPYMAMPKAPTPETPLTTIEASKQKPFIHVLKAPTSERPLTTIEASEQKTPTHVPRTQTSGRRLKTKEASEQKPFMRMPKAQTTDRPLTPIEAPVHKSSMHVPNSPNRERPLTPIDVSAQKPFMHLPKAPTPERHLTPIEAPTQKQSMHVPNAPNRERPLTPIKAPAQKSSMHVPNAPNRERPLTPIEAPGPNAPNRERPLTPIKAPAQKLSMHVPNAPNRERPLTPIEAPAQKSSMHVPNSPNRERPLTPIEAPAQKSSMHIPKAQTPGRHLMPIEASRQKPYVHVPKALAPERPLTTIEAPEQNAFMHVPKAPTPERHLTTMVASAQKPHIHMPKALAKERPLTGREAPEQKAFMHVPKDPTSERPLTTMEASAQKSYIHVPKALAPERPSMTKEASEQKRFMHVPKAPNPERPLTTMEASVQKPYVHLPKAPTPERPLTTIEASAQKPYTHVPKAPTLERPLTTMEASEQKPSMHVPKAPTPERHLTTIEVPEQKPYTHVPKDQTLERPLTTMEAPEQEPFIHIPKAPTSEKPKQVRISRKYKNMSTEEQSRLQELMQTNNVMPKAPDGENDKRKYRRRY